MSRLRSNENDSRREVQTSPQRKVRMISLLLLAAHLVGDFVTQTPWMAANKLVKYEIVYRSSIGEPGQPFLGPTNFWFSAAVRALHVTIYTAGFAPIAWFCRLSVDRGVSFLVAVWLTHFVTDCRRWASDKSWCAKPIMVDQAIHITTLAILGVLFKL